MSEARELSTDRSCCFGALERGSIGSSPGGAALLIASACGGLRRIDRVGTRVMASWPRHLLPVQVVGVPVAGASEEAYLVSFGRVAARFSASSAEWFAPRHCVDVAVGSDSRCSCVAAAP